VDKEFNLPNLETAVGEMRREDSGIPVIGKRQRCSPCLRLSNFAIKLGFNVKSAEEFIRHELGE